MPRGGKPKPTAVKALEGNPGGRPLNPNEPKPRAEFPYCPRGLDPMAKREWHRIKREYQRLGVVTPLDAGALAAYCQSFATWRKAEKQLAAEGFVILTARGMVANPLANISHKALSQMRYYMVELGLTPSSRSRIRIEPPRPEDPFEKYLGESRVMDKLDEHR